MLGDNVETVGFDVVGSKVGVENVGGSEGVGLFVGFLVGLCVGGAHISGLQNETNEV